MEDAADAIVMAGAILVFVIALSLAMTMFTTARSTADVVLYASDTTNYYEYMDIANNTAKNRVVSWETVIPTLYKYYKENYTVVFLDKNGNGLKLYQSKTNALLWSGNTTGKEEDIPSIASKYPGMENEEKKTMNWICSFDVAEENTRHEPWTANDEYTKENLDCFLNGGEFEYPSGTGSYNYESFINKMGSNVQFIETIGEYSTNTKDTFAATLNQGIRDNKNKRVIVYQVK